MNYGTILKQAITVTVRHPLLWVYGLFVVGTFNLNFFYFQDATWDQYFTPQYFHHLLVFFSRHSGWLLLITLGVLAGAWLGILVTNWARILLVLSTKKILDKQQVVTKELAANAYRVQWPVIGMSLITTALMVIAAAVLLVPPLYMHDGSRQALFWMVSALTFLPLSFALSFINIFGSFYIIVYQRSLGSALNFASDFFVANWGKVLGMLIILGILYMGALGIGIALNFLLNASISLAVSAGGAFSFLGFSAIIIVMRAASLIIFWLFLAILNVVFNTVLLLLFLDLAKPVKQIPAKDMAVSPAVP